MPQHGRTRPPLRRPPRLTRLVSVPRARADGDEASIVAAARNVSLDFRKREWSAEGMGAAKDFVRACMVADMERRPKAQELLEHAWLTGRPPANGVNAAFVTMLEETVAIEKGQKQSL
jgi:hypothetical protein